MSDPYKEASKFNTALKRADKWRDDYVNGVIAKHAEKVRALRADLSPAAQRIVAAAELEPHEDAVIKIVEPEYSTDVDPPAMTKGPESLGWVKPGELDEKPMTEDEMSRETVKAEMKAARKAARGA